MDWQGALAVLIWVIVVASVLGVLAYVAIGIVWFKLFKRATKEMDKPRKSRF